MGILLPSIVLFLFYQATKASLTFEEYVGFLDTFQVLTSVIALSALANLGAFFWFLKKEHYETARGIIFATLLIAIGVALYKI